MKHILTTLLTWLIIFTSDAQIGGNFSLTGKIKGHDYDYLYLTYEDATGHRVRDSVLITNGSFNFKGQIKEPTMAFINGTMGNGGMDDPNAASIFLEPSAMKVSLTADHFKDFDLSGSKTQDEFSALEKQKAAILEEKQPYVDAYLKEKDHEKAAEIREQFASFDTQLDKIDLDYIKTHPKSYLSAHLMRFKMSKLTAAQALEIYNSWTNELKESSYGIHINKEIKNLLGGSPGAKAFQFTTTDINGQELDLADFKGKYVLLDFWASWCVPCRKGNPHLITIYQKYKNQNKGLEIIGISDDDRNHDAWKKAVADDKIGIWKHVLRGLKHTDKGYDKSEDISEPYGIHTLPTKILINPDGIIIGRYGGGGEDDEAMDKKLAEIFL